MSEKDENVTMEEEMEEEVVTLVDDEGNEVDFYEVATLDYKDKWYIFLEPAEELEGFEDGDLLIYELGEDDKGEETFLPVESEETLNAVFAEFQKMMEEEGEEDE